MTYRDPVAIDVLAPNFKKRLSGVTATVVRLVPLQARDIAIAAVAPALPASVPQIRMRDVLTMSRLGPSGARVWHARRNSEMLAGIVLKRILGKRLKLVFTSASQRRHTRYSKWLIGQKDHVISTSRKTAAYLENPLESQIGRGVFQGFQMGGNLDPHDIDRHAMGDHRPALPWPGMRPRSHWR